MDVVELLSFEVKSQE